MGEARILEVPDDLAGRRDGGDLRGHGAGRRERHRGGRVVSRARGERGERVTHREDECAWRKEATESHGSTCSVNSAEAV